MRKLIIALSVGAVLGGLSMGMVGCTEETGVREETKIKGPGGTTTEERSVTVKKSGDNAPAAPSEKANP